KHRIPRRPENKLELLTPVRLDDDAGGASISWLPGAEVWAQIQQLTSTRDYFGDRTHRLRRIAATIRHRTDIVLGWRVRFEDADYEVVSIENDRDDRARLTLVCEEAVI
ncbi:MAG: phage head closure protein, partial [Pseudomonadota bacterium]